MNQADFEKKLKAEGYDEMVDRRMEANHFNPEHAHEFDACVLVVDGEMTIARNGTPQVFRAGDTCSMDAGTPHTRDDAAPAGDCAYPRRAALCAKGGQLTSTAGAPAREPASSCGGIGVGQKYGPVSMRDSRSRYKSCILSHMACETGRSVRQICAKGRCERACANE